MAKPQPLPEPLPTNIAQIKTLIDVHLDGLKEENNKIRLAKEDVDDYHRQIFILREHALKIFGLDIYNPNL